MSGLYKCSYGYTAFLQSPWSWNPDPPRQQLLQAWSNEGIFVKSLLLSPASNRRLVQVICETSALISPVFLAQRLKGRLQQALKEESADFPGFTRDLDLISLGGNDRNIVRTYIREQVNYSDLVDPLYRKRMNSLRFEQVPTKPPRGKHRGIQDHALHMVFVVAGRHRLFSNQAKDVASSLLEAAEVLKIEVHGFSIMPDHAHLLVRPDHHASLRENQERLQQESHQCLRRSAFWQAGGYAGTVGPYPIGDALDKTRKLGGWILP